MGLKSKRKFYEKLKNNPRNIKYKELLKAVKVFGFIYARTRGSHVIYINKNPYLFINLQPDKRDSTKAKVYQVEDFIKMIEDNNLVEND